MEPVLSSEGMLAEDSESEMVLMAREVETVEAKTKTLSSFLEMILAEVVVIVMIVEILAQAKMENQKISSSCSGSRLRAAASRTDIFHRCMFSDA